MKRLLHYSLLAVILVGLPLACCILVGKDDILDLVFTVAPKTSDWGNHPELLWNCRRPFSWWAFAAILGIDKSYMRGVVVFVGGSTFKTERPEGVVSADGVARYIRSVNVPIIKDEQVPEIASAIAEWQATLSRNQVSSHVANLKKSHQAVAESDSPVCPRCGVPMALRTARATGKKFYGCSNYPQCRGMRPVEA